MFDPEADVGGSTDASKPGFQQQFQDWQSKPENKAALLQFGIAMLQPRAPGQSGLGSIANAVGEGAGASNRVLESQKADELQAANIADKESQRENQKTTAESGRITANAYDYGVRNKQAAGTVGGTSGALRVQQDFRKWLAKPEDTTGLSVDPVVGAISKQFPNIKTKGDLLADPAALAAARRLFSQQMTTEPSDSGELGTEAPAAPAAAPQSYPKYKLGDKIIQYDPAKKSYVDQNGNLVKQ